MVDILYNVLTRPVATEPDSKDVYHIDPSPKDAKTKRIEDDDPNKQNPQHHQKHNKQQEQEEELEKKLEPEQKGKGKYLGKDGKEHLDFFA